MCSPPGTLVPLPAAERALAFLRWLGLPLLRRAAATNTGAVVVDRMQAGGGGGGGGDGGGQGFNIRCVARGV